MSTTDTTHLEKARHDDFEGRIREVLADPSNRHIPRVANAGTYKDGNIVMHNGLLVVPELYGELFKVLLLNRGVHEPQEERMFMEVLKHMPDGATMIELGANWAFYSMWFQKEVPNARNFMIEPDPENLNRGVRNFRLNDFNGQFLRGGVGPGAQGLRQFLTQAKIEYIDLLHADIQGAELHLLEAIRDLLDARKVGYIFISTHSQELHEQCTEFLVGCDYLILGSADFDHETFCHDGVLVARDNSLDGLKPIALDVRTTAPR